MSRGASPSGVHADEAILVPDHPSHFDPDRWRPLMMSFCEFYGLGERVHPSRLADAYRPAAEPSATPARRKRPARVRAGR